MCLSNKTLAPPQLSAAELKAQEDEATLTIQKAISAAVLLYLCKSHSMYCTCSKNIADRSYSSSVRDRCHQEACINERFERCSNTIMIEMGDRTDVYKRDMGCMDGDMTGIMHFGFLMSCSYP